MEKHNPEAMKALKLALDFDPEDLVANRDGYMTQRQREKLSDSRMLWTIGLILALLTFPVGAYFAIQDWFHIHNMPASGLGFILVASPVAAVFCWRHKTRLDDDLYRGYVSSVEGLVHLDMFNEGKNGIRYVLEIADVRFKIDNTISLAFKNGDPYAIYYAPHSKTLLSAQWLRE